MLSNRIEPVTGLNVAAHLSLAIGARAPSELMGRTHLLDATGISHAGISRYAVVILMSSTQKVRRAVEDARNVTELTVADFPSEMLMTSHDDELASALESQPEPALEYLGVGAFGPSDMINDIFGRFSLWRQG